LNVIVTIWQGRFPQSLILYRNIVFLPKSQGSYP